MMGSLGMGAGVFGLVLMILFWAGLIALAIWLIRALFPPVGQPPAPATERDLNAREILDRRFARGEISREEYDLMRETITNGVA
ncbi:MAG: SHOCT domain-containing protein [Anaerolineae bacterium]|jgi:putative membrane protein